MKPLKIHSEKFRPEGGASGQGIMRALGRPRLDRISVLIREAVQNSWDARIRTGAPATVSVSAVLARFSKSELEVLKSTVFAATPPNHPLKALLRPGMRRLTLEDRGTVGLCGPVFVEKPPTADDRFINFCRMFGRASEGPLGGGTFGYGKAVYFGSSQAATIIIFTRCQDGARRADRLIAMSLWKATDQQMDTGRHWWGVPSDRHRHVTGPVTGQEARKLAKDIGFAPFLDDETGTSIMILAPRFDGALSEHPVVAAKCIAESMVIWFWPRMLGAADKLGKLQFSVECDKEAVSVPDPAKDTPFSGYARALKNLVANARRGRDIQPPHIVQEIRSARPAARLGYLSIALAPRHPRKDFAIVSEAPDGPYIEDHAFADQVDEGATQPAHCHHIALVRAPGQVIKYMQYRPYPDAGMEYTGVFLVDGEHDHSGRSADDVDVAFARAEPPSHDDWVPDELEDDWHKRYVRVGYREIRESADAFVDLGRPAVDSISQDPLGAISADLGELLGTPGNGASPAGRGTGGGGGGGSARGGQAQIQITGDGMLEDLDGSPVFVLPFRIEGPLEQPIVLRASPRVLLAGGGTETEAPTGDGQPTVLGWRKGSKSVETSDLRVRVGDTGDWQVVVGIAGEAMIGVSLSIVST